MSKRRQIFITTWIFLILLQNLPPELFTRTSNHTDSFFPVRGSLQLKCLKDQWRRDLIDMHLCCNYGTCTAHVYNLKLQLLKTPQAALKTWQQKNSERQLQKTPGDVFNLRTVLSTAHSCSPSSTGVCVNWHTSCNVWAARQRRKTSPTKPFQWGKLKIPTQWGWKPQSLSFSVHRWPEPADCTGKHVLQPIPWAWREKCSCFPQSRLHAAKDAPCLLQPFRTAECRVWYHLFCNVNFMEFALFTTESQTRTGTSFSLSPTGHKTSCGDPNTYPQNHPARLLSLPTFTQAKLHVKKTKVTIY